MENVNVSKPELLEKLKENRKNHRAIVEEAWEGYLNEATKILEKQIKRAKKGLRVNHSVALVMPQDHTNDYDVAIAMVEMEVNDTIELSVYDFRSYILDQWDWKGQWTVSNSMYASSLQG